MSLRTEFENSGAWLFRYRSFLPVGAIPVFASCFLSYQYIAHSHALTEIGQKTGLLTSLLGLTVRILTIGYATAGTSGRNTKNQVADTLNTTGMYSLVRHPLYFGNYLIVLGLLIGFHSWIAFLLTSCIFALFYERIMFAEEAFLRKRFADRFEDWADKTPAFFPHHAGWVQPRVAFCWRTVLRREYTGLVLITTLFFLLDFIGDSIMEKRLILSWLWTTLLIVGFFAWFTLRMLKKHTRVLHMAGR